MAAKRPLRLVNIQLYYGYRITLICRLTKYPQYNRSHLLKQIKRFDKDVNEETGRHKFTRNDTTVSVDSSIIREQNKEAGHTSSQGFITMLDSQGNIKEVGFRQGRIYEFVHRGGGA